MIIKLWEGYAIGMTDDQIAVAFQKLHHRAPAEVWRDKAIAHAGPISAEEHRAKQRIGERRGSDQDRG